GEGRIDRAVAAVGDRAGGDLGVRGRGGDPAGEGGDDLGGGEGALELVGGEEEAGHAVLAICSTVSDGWDMAKARAAVADVMALVGILRKQSHACSLGPRLGLPVTWASRRQGRTGGTVERPVRTGRRWLTAPGPRR